MQSQIHWVAVYKDGSKHTQEELKNSENIDRTQLKEFRLFENKKLIFVAMFNGKRKLIFRKRTLSDGFTGEYQDTVYLVGWHEKVRGVSVKSICYIYSDGHVEFDDARNNLQLVPCEM